ncbi:uncharacterized protein V1516DRAFT_689858 [Lipomyces oligophaga]|uniref:uncharacterized protein n=1 Tax=Lipomyces oligophaga TaxID=45792 RepID=UPI0034CF7B25
MIQIIRKPLRQVIGIRLISTLSTNPQVYIHENNVLSLSPSTAALSIGQLQDVGRLVETEFKAQNGFLQLMHETLREQVHDDKYFNSLAASYGEGYMAIYDMRAPPTYGRVPEVSDTFGLVLVKQGNIVPKSYEANNFYRLLSPDGVCMFTDWMYKRVRKACENYDKL